MKPKFKRAVKLVGALILLGFGAWLVLSQFNENIVFYYNPSEVPENKKTRILRIGGFVKEGSLKKDKLKVEFILTDFIKEIVVKYEGITPALFTEGQGAVVKGKFKENIFLADEILAKHDENYLPKGLSDSLKKNGVYQGND